MQFSRLFVAAFKSHFYMVKQFISMGNDNCRQTLFRKLFLHNAEA